MKQFEVKRKQIEYFSMFLEILILWVIARSVAMQGMGFLCVALALYYVLWIVVAEFVPDALGRMIRVRKSKGQFISIQKIKGMAFLWQGVTGLAGSLILLTIGSFFAETVYHSPYSRLMVWILSPLVFLRALSALFTGFTQGEGTELPAVISSLLRPAMIYSFGIIFGRIFQTYGEKVSLLLKQELYTAMYTGAGWCLAMTLAELLIVLFSLLSYLGARRIRKGDESESMRGRDSFSGFLGGIYGSMGGKILVSLMEAFPAFIGMMIYYHKDAGSVMAGYGSYFTGFWSVCLACMYLMRIITVPYWGKVAGLLKRDERRLAKQSFQGGMHLHFALGFWIAVSFSVMAAQVGGMVGFTSPNMVKIVGPGSYCILFLVLGFYFSRMIMRLGKGLLSVGMGLLCDILFLMIYLILLSNSQNGVMALMYATLIATGVYAFLLGAMCIQLLGIRTNWLQVFVIPLVVGGVIGFLELLCAGFIINYLGNFLTVVITGGLGFFGFWCGLLLLRNFREEELSVMPFGGAIHILGSLLGVF